MKRFAIVLAIVSLLAISLTSTGIAATQTVTISGSTTVYPLVEELVNAYREANPGVRFSVQAGGSGMGITNAREGVADIGMSSRDIRPSEKEFGLDEWVIAIDAIAVIINNGVTVQNITMEQLKQIFTGEIKSWYQVGGPDEPITVVNREAGSGTRGAFQSIVLGGADFTDEALEGDGTGTIHRMVATTPWSIGYISLGYMDHNVTAIGVNGVPASVEAVVSGDYKVSRPLILLTKGGISTTASDFLEFAMGPEGQSIAAYAYIPVGPTE